MPRHLLLVISLGLLAATPAVSLAQGATVQQSYAGGEPNRLTNDVQRELVADALRRIEAGDIPGAEVKFKAQLAEIAKAHGPRSVEEADAVTAFAAQLYGAHYLKESLPYFRRTVSAYSEARGADHPDVAVAEQDYAKLLWEAAQDAPPAEAVALLEDAYRIRAKVLGLKDAETAVNLSLLGQMKGDPGFTQGDPGKIEAAADLVRRAIALLPACNNKLARDLPDAHRRLVVIYAQNDKAAEALVAFDAYLAADRENAEGAAGDVAAILWRHDHRDAARRVLALQPASS